MRQLVEYNPLTGIIIWRPRGKPGWDVRWAGNRAFCCMTHGYYVGVILGKRSIGAHRVAFKYVHGFEPDEIDHINGVRTDNRIANLRSVSRLENRRNAATPKTNKSGIVGVHFKKQKKKWVAYISENDKYKHIGYFDTKEAAAVARKQAEHDLGFHPNHGRVLCL